MAVSVFEPHSILTTELFSMDCVLQHNRIKSSWPIRCWGSMFVMWLSKYNSGQGRHIFWELHPPSYTNGTCFLVVIDIVRLFGGHIRKDSFLHCWWECKLVVHLLRSRIHSSILPWRIPLPEYLCRLQSMEPQGVDMTEWLSTQNTTEKSVEVPEKTKSIT